MYERSYMLFDVIGGHLVIARNISKLFKIPAFSFCNKCHLNAFSYLVTMLHKQSFWTLYVWSIWMTEPSMLLVSCMNQLNDCFNGDLFIFNQESIYTYKTSMIACLHTNLTFHLDMVGRKVFCFANLILYNTYKKKSTHLTQKCGV